MSFLQSLFLAGLAAAVIPLLIHLLSRPRARVIPFSTLEFIRRLQIKKSKRIRFREILLLVLRVLLIMLIALAFARPALRGVLPGGLGGRAKTTACILLDGSYSMSFREGETTLFEEAKERAREVVGLLQEGDEALLILATDAPEWRLEKPTHNFRLLRSEIDKASFSYRGTDVAFSLQEAARALEESRNANREVYLITDLQRTTYDLGEEEWAEWSGENRLFLLPVGGEERQNLAIVGAELFEPRQFGETVRIRATVRNYGSEPTEGTVTLLLDGERRGSSPVRIGPGESEPVQFSLIVRDGGVHRGEIRLDEDRLPADDVFYFRLDRPDRLRVLLLGEEGEEGLTFLASALAPGSGEGSMIDVKRADPSEIRTLRLGDFHAVFLVGIPSLDEKGVARLEQYLLGGGGVVIVPGDALDFGFYNTVLLPRLLGSPRIAPSLVERREHPAGVQLADREHPLFAIFRRGLDDALRELRVARYLDVTAGEGALMVAATDDGRPLLLEARRGAGRAFLWSVGFDLPWSDLPTRGVFLPLQHEMVRYLYSGGALHQASLPVGRPYRADLSGVALGEELICTTPREEVAVQPGSEGDRFFIDFEETNYPGFYSIEGGGVSALFAVNPDTEESNPAPLSLDEAEASLPEEATLVPPGVRLDRPVSEARYGRELWWELVWLALALAVVELVLARSRRTSPAE